MTIAGPTSRRRARRVLSLALLALAPMLLAAAPAGEPGTDDPDPEAAREAVRDAIRETLAGPVVVRFEESYRSCGDVARPAEVRTQVQVSDDADTLRVRFPTALLGRRVLDLSLDLDSGALGARIEHTSREGSVESTVRLDIDGWVDAWDTFVEAAASGGELPPLDVELEYRFDKAATDPGQDCLIEGIVTARVAP